MVQAPEYYNYKFFVMVMGTAIFKGYAFILAIHFYPSLIFAAQV